MPIFTESIIEQATLDWLADLKYQIAFGPDLAFDGNTPERQNYQNVILSGRLQESLHRINPILPAVCPSRSLPPAHPIPTNPRYSSTTMPFTACWWRAFPWITMPKMVAWLAGAFR